MSSQFDRDPFRAAPSSFSASSQYLQNAYVGPERPPVLPLAAASLSVGVLALVCAGIFAVAAAFDVPGFVELLARVSLFAGVVLALTAVVLGHVSFLRADRLNLRGRGHSSAAFIMGYASFVILFIAVVASSSDPGTSGIV